MKGSSNRSTNERRDVGLVSRDCGDRVAVGYEEEDEVDGLIRGNEVFVEF